MTFFFFEMTRCNCVCVWLQEERFVKNYYYYYDCLLFMFINSICIHLFLVWFLAWFASALNSTSQAPPRVLHLSLYYRQIVDNNLFVLF